MWSDGVVIMNKKLNNDDNLCKCLWFVMSEITLTDFVDRFNGRVG